MWPRGKTYYLMLAIYPNINNFLFVREYFVIIINLIFLLPSIRDEPLEHSQPLVEVPTVLSNKRAMGGLDAFTKTYYHLPSGVGVVDEKSMGAGRDARKMAKEAHILMEHCRDQVNLVFGDENEVYVFKTCSF